MSSKIKKQQLSQSESSGGQRPLPIPEDYELSDEEPTTINLNEEQNYQANWLPLIAHCVRGNYNWEMKLKSTPREWNVNVIRAHSKSAKMIKQWM